MALTQFDESNVYDVYVSGASPAKNIFFGYQNIDKVDLDESYIKFKDKIKQWSLSPTVTIILSPPFPSQLLTAH